MSYRNQPAFFLSASSEDALLSRLTNDPKIRGNIWSPRIHDARRGTIVTDSQQQEIERAMAGSGVVVALLSSSFAADNQSMALLQRAVAAGKKVVPVYARPMDIPGMKALTGIPDPYPSTALTSMSTSRAESEYVQIVNQIDNAVQATRSQQVQPRVVTQQTIINPAARELEEQYGRLHQQQDMLVSTRSDLTAKETALHNEEQRLADWARKLFAREQAVQEREQAATVRENNLKTGEEILRQGQERLKTEQEALRAEQIQFYQGKSPQAAVSTPSAVQKETEESKREEKLVLTPEERIQKLSQEGYEPQRMQLHIVTAPGDEKLRKQFITAASGMVRTGLAEVTCSNDPAGTSRAGLTTHDINPANEADRVKTADMVLFLKGPNSIVDDHAIEMLELAERTKSAYNNSYSYRTVPINFVSTAFDLPELKGLIGLPRNGKAISEAGNTEQVLADVMQELGVAAKNMAEKKGLGRAGGGQDRSPFSAFAVDEAKLEQLGLKIPGDTSSQEQVRTYNAKGAKLPGQSRATGWDRQ